MVLQWYCFTCWCSQYSGNHISCMLMRFRKTGGVNRLHVFSTLKARGEWKAAMWQAPLRLRCADRWLANNDLWRDVASTRQRCDLVGCIGAQTNLRADRFEHRHTWVAVAYRQMELTAATEDVARFSDYCDLVSRQLLNQSKRRCWLRWWMQTWHHAWRQVAASTETKTNPLLLVL